jgi:hypothetical protein
MADSCRGAYKSLTSTKQSMVQGGVFLKQVIITPIETTDGREITVTLYDGLDSAATNEKFKVSVPRQLNNNTLVNIINRLVGVDDSSGDPNPYPIGSINWVIEHLNDHVLGPLNAITSFPTGLNLTFGGLTAWANFLSNLDTAHLRIAISNGFTYSSLPGFPRDLFQHFTTDDDTEMSYDRNAAKVITLPEPGLFFKTGIVGKSLRASTASTSSTSHVTCIYQQAPSTTIGGTIKVAYHDGGDNAEDGSFSGDPGSNQLLINQPCKIHSIHLFNDHSVEQGITFFNGTEEIARFFAGDNSLSQIYLPKPGFIFNNNVYIRQTAYNARVRLCAIYQEI